VTTGDADGNRGTAYHVNPEPKVGKVGLEWWWALCEDPDYQYMNMIILASERECNISWQWVFNSSSELWKIEYKDSDNNWVELVSGMDYWSGTRMFHSNKLVVDLVTEENVRFSMDGTDYDMSGIALNADDCGVEGYWETQFGLYTGENSSKSMYFDTVILTQNEP